MVPNPHDALFKAVLGQVEHARGALRSWVPAALAEEIDWPALALQPGSFVDQALKEQHTDLVYSAPWRGGAVLVYFLFEHLSALPKDGLVAYRMLRYQVRIWEKWCADHPKEKELPLILPVVLYHGTAPWTEPRQLDTLLAIPTGARAEVEPYLVRCSYLLVDLSKISDTELRSSEMLTALVKLTGICFKHARTYPDFLQILSRWMDVAREVLDAPNGLHALSQLLLYILHVNHRVEQRALEELLERELGSKAKDTTMGLLEKSRLQGRQQGFQELLMRLLRQRFGGEVDAGVEQRVTGASVEQIEVWSSRVLSAGTLAEVMIA